MSHASIRPPPNLSPASARRRHARFWVVTLAALLAIGLTLALGRWQLARAAYKEGLQAAMDAQSTYPALDMSAFGALEDAAAELHRKVRLRGLWLPAHTVWLDNRQMDGRQGFYVLTPLALEGSNQTVLVQRGWAPRNFVDRTQLPPIETPAGLVDVQAQIAPPPGHLLALGPAASESAAPGASPIRQNLDLQAFRSETGLPLRTDITLVETGPGSQGLLRDWPAPSLGIEKHYGYAFQWFGLSFLVLLLYVWFQLIAPWRRARRDRQAGHA